jgi:hypothetical protein
LIKKGRFPKSVPFVFLTEMRKSRFMKALPLCFIFFGLFAISASAQTAVKPAFKSYPATVEKAQVSTVNFKNNSAVRTMRTRLTEALHGGVNFAGHYIVAGWGCGTGCISGAIIDARTGNVLWPLPLNALGVCYAGDSYVDKPVEYRKDSRLLIIRGSPGTKDNEQDRPNGQYYYEWTGSDLKQVKFIPYKTN